VPNQGEEHMSKVGVMIPTYNRPDFVRGAVLQWIAQTRKPDIVCIHQNGNEDSYEWAIEDLKPLININWIHISKELPQHLWYAIPLALLIHEGCDVFLWADHDDIYYTNHIEKSLENLEDYDITLSDTCGVLYLKEKQFKYQRPEKFQAHAPGGMSSSMVFNKRFALHLYSDLIKDSDYYYSDNVVAHKTMPKNRVNITSSNTTVYVSHKGSHSSGLWPDEAFPEENT
jgi:hypothetical protein